MSQTLATLDQVAEINSGMTIRDRDDLLAVGTVRVIQLRSFNESTLNLDDVDYLDRAMPAKKSLLEPGDLVVRSRGRFAVGLFAGDELPTVAGAPLLVIRLRDGVFLPEYVAWYLNETPEARAHWGRAWQGTSAPAITIADLRRIELPIPSIETQRRIAEAAALVQHQHQLERQLADKRRDYRNGLLAELAKNGAKES
jgi:restriction endonuclease S subunit